MQNIIETAVQALYRRLRAGKQRVIEAALLFHRESRWPELIASFAEQRVLILAPHMDDEVFGCGGVAIRHGAAGGEVEIVYLTDGRRGDVRLHDARITPAAALAMEEEVVAVRRQEAEAAAALLGVVKLHFMEAEDGRLGLDPTVAPRLAQQMAGHPPDLVYLPSPFDTHADHWQAVRIFVAAGARMPLAWRDSVRVRCYEVCAPVVANRLADISGEMTQKLRAMAAHQSQLRDRDFVRCVEGLNAYRAIGLPGGAGYAEAFFECSFSMLSLIAQRVTL